MKRFVALASAAFLSAAGCAHGRDEAGTTSHLPPATSEAPFATTNAEPLHSFQERQPETMPLAHTPRIGVIRGKVLDVTANKIEVGGKPLAGPFAAVTMFVGPVTRVTLNGRKASFRELRPGMNVEASFTQERSTVIADHLDARTPGR